MSEASPPSSAGKRRVLALYYSQTGQLHDVLASFLRGLDETKFDIDVEAIRPAVDYPFPWSFGAFMDVFPESALGRPPAIAPPAFDPDARYDLVVLAYTVWFLAPSLPIQGFLASEHARVLRGTPVVTLIACRNMWHNASMRMKRDLERVGAHLIDNVAVVDQGPAWATFVTTPRWMFTGRKDAFWRVFPPAGVGEDVVDRAERFGRAFSANHAAVDRDLREPQLRGLGAVVVERRYIIPELVGSRLFAFWARLVRLTGPPGGRLRRAALYVFTVFLLFSVLVLLPVLIVTRLVLYPFLRRPIAAYADRLEAPSGAATPTA